MRSLQRAGRGALAALLGLSLVVWTVAPVVGHATAVFETLRGHAEMIADHGHSHGFAEDLHLALHGHSHDAADHDHTEAMPGFDDGPRLAGGESDTRRLPRAAAGPYRVFRTERPPRA
jgi:hypothetical protein